jgi:putative hydrolase of the HAD superfamily
MSDHEMLGAIHRRFDPRLLLNDDWLFDQWCSIFIPIPGAIELVDALDEGCHRGLISNTNHLHFEWLDELLGLRSRFETVTLSHELGCLKPAPDIYHAALRDAQCPPERAIFIDDLAENVAAAEAVGMRGVRFEGVDKLRGVLASEGLLTGA